MDAGCKTKYKHEHIKEQLGKAEGERLALEDKSVKAKEERLANAKQEQDIESENLNTEENKSSRRTMRPRNI